MLEPLDYALLDRLSGGRDGAAPQPVDALAAWAGEVVDDVAARLRFLELLGYVSARESAYVITREGVLALGRPPA
jgi:hypothetical protein